MRTVPRTAEERAIAAASTEELLESISADELHPEDITDLRYCTSVADGRGW